MRRRGFSILELVVAMSIFMILSVLIFSFFRYGTRSFYSANARNSLQSDALRVIEGLQLELGRSAHTSVRIVNDSSRQVDIDGEQYQRDVISFVALEKWYDGLNTAQYDPDTGAPLWNRYWVYYADRSPEGKVYRLKVDPDPPPLAAVRLPRDQFDDLYNDDPNSNLFSGKLPGYTMLAKNVEEFSVKKVTEGEFNISIKLKEKHQKRPSEDGKVREFDFYEIQTNIRPHNSYPNNF